MKNYIEYKNDWFIYRFWEIALRNLSRQSAFEVYVLTNIRKTYPMTFRQYIYWTVIVDSA